MAMLPHEKELVAKWRDRPFALVAVNSDQGGPEALRKRLADNGIAWRNAMDGSTTGPLAKAWNVHAWPTLYLIDADGVIRVRGRDFEKAAEELLKKAEGAGKKKGEGRKDGAPEKGGGEGTPTEPVK